MAEWKTWPALKLTRERLQPLDGRSVLVRPAHSNANPVTGVRGTIRVGAVDESSGSPQIAIVVRFPEMFVQRARERVIDLTEGDVERLLASETNGDFALAFDGDLNPSDAAD